LENLKVIGNVDFKFPKMSFVLNDPKDMEFTHVYLASNRHICIDTKNRTSAKETGEISISEITSYHKYIGILKI
jgi:hypothetical protein